MRKEFFCKINHGEDAWMDRWKQKISKLKQRSKKYCKTQKSRYKTCETVLGV